MKDQGTVPTVSVGKTDFLLLDCNAVMQSTRLWFNHPSLEHSDVFLKSLEMHHLWISDICTSATSVRLWVLTFSWYGDQQSTCNSANS